MFYETEFVSLFSIAICIAGDITLMDNSETWYDALERCFEHNSSLANIKDIESDHFCEKRHPLKIKNAYWFGNFYKLSNRISIEGCSDISFQKIEDGYKSLHNCFEHCEGKINTTGLFAHKAVLGKNCICDLHFNSIDFQNFPKPNSSKCMVNFPFWWIYKVHIHYLNTSNEACRQISCNESQSINAILRKNNCGKHSTVDSYLRTPVPQAELPYICESNAANSTTSMDYFRFVVKASVKQDRIEKSTIILKCEAIFCSNSFNFRVIQQNCESKTSGFLCINESNISHETTSSTPNIFSGTFSTISYHLNTLEHEQKENAKYGTGSSKITTQMTFHPSILPPHSSPGHVENSQVGITSPKRSSTKVLLNTEGLPTIPSRNSFLHTSIYTTDLVEMNVAESTTQTSKVIPNGHHGNSQIGLIVGSAGATVVILVAVVLIVSCRLRHLGPFRKKKFDDDIQINELNDSNYQDDISITPTCNVHNTMYDVHTPNGDNKKIGLLDVSHDNSNNIRNNEYAIVVKTKQSGTDVVKQDCDTNGRNYNDLLENENDRNNHERPSSWYSSSNILNNEYAVVVKNNQSSNQVLDQNCGMKAENHNDLTECEYDRLNHVRSRSGIDSSNIYDSALGFREEYDATYNMTDYRGSDKRDDAVYDHA